MAVFSQIPSIVLQKNRIHDGTKSVRFYDDDPIEVIEVCENSDPVTSSSNYQSESNEASTKPQPTRYPVRSATKIKESKKSRDEFLVPTVPPKTSSQNQEETESHDSIVKSDAIIQTELVKLVDRSTQTVESFLTRPLDDYDVQQANHLNQFNESTHRVMSYRIPKHRQPPLKVGLSKRGKKRQVFYPDLENEVKVES